MTKPVLDYKGPERTNPKDPFAKEPVRRPSWEPRASFALGCATLTMDALLWLGFFEMGNSAIVPLLAAWTTLALATGGISCGVRGQPRRSRLAAVGLYLSCLGLLVFIGMVVMFVTNFTM